MKRQYPKPIFLLTHQRLSLSQPSRIAPQTRATTGPLVSKPRKATNACAKRDILELTARQKKMNVYQARALKEQLVLTRYIYY